MIEEVNSTTPPTQAKGAWLYATCDNPQYPKHTERTGKWLVFLADELIDRYWLLVCQSLAEHRLGRQAKVSTSTSRQEQYVIVVYTYDYADEADVMRVRKELYDLGIHQKLSYKSDEQTSQGSYGKNYKGRNRTGNFTPIYRV